MAQGRSTEIITMIKWIRTSRLSIKELSLSLPSPSCRQTLSAPLRERRRGGGTLLRISVVGVVRCSKSQPCATECEYWFYALCLCPGLRSYTTCGVNLATLDAPAQTQTRWGCMHGDRVGSHQGPSRERLFPSLPGYDFALNPHQETSHPNTQTPNPKSQTLHPKPQTPYPEPQTPNPIPYPLRPEPQTPNPKPQSLNPKPQTPNPGEGAVSYERGTPVGCGGAADAAGGRGQFHLALVK